MYWDGFFVLFSFLSHMVFLALLLHSYYLRTPASFVFDGENTCKFLGTLWIFIAKVW